MSHSRLIVGWSVVEGNSGLLLFCIQMRSLSMLMKQIDFFEVIPGLGYTRN